MSLGTVARRTPALRFFVELVDAEGGAADDLGERVVLLLDDGLRRQLELPEELVVSDDPEVVAEEGGLLVVPGQPVVVDAAELVLRRGDAGWRHVEWPRPPLPAREQLQEAARDQIAVDHGRLDVEGQPAPCYLPVLELAALLEHRVLLEERSEERARVLVDACSAVVLPVQTSERLSRLTTRSGRGSGYTCVEPDLPRALAAADAALGDLAAARQAVLVREARALMESERARVNAYYEAAIASIDARRAGAPSERARLYDAQDQATRAEWARRRDETEEKFAGSCEVLPYRAHVIEVPGMRVPVTVRRGARAYAMTLHWLTPLGAFAPCRCPHCGAEQPLVAGRDRLGCGECLPRVVGAGAGQPPGGARAASSGGVADTVPVVAATRAAPEAPAGGGAQAPAQAPAPGGADPQERADPRHAARVEKVWRDTASAFWRSVAMQERYRSVAPRSPLEALYRCYGALGPVHAVGLPADTWLSSVHAFGPDDPCDDVVATDGVLRTSHGPVRFVLRWRLAGREPSMVEVLPFRAPRGGRSLPPLRRGQGAPSAPRPGGHAPRPADLGPVEALLWTRVIADGLPLVMRCLALYWRVQGHRRLARIGPDALAAAVELTARRLSLLRADASSVSRRHGVVPAAVREACEALDTVLGAASAHMW